MPDGYFFFQNEEMFMLRKRYFIIVDKQFGEKETTVYFFSGFTSEASMETAPLCTFLEIVLQYFICIGK